MSGLVGQRDRFSHDADQFYFWGKHKCMSISYKLGTGNIRRDKLTDDLCSCYSLKACNGLKALNRTDYVMTKPALLRMRKLIAQISCASVHLVSTA